MNRKPSGAAPGAVVDGRGGRLACSFFSAVRRGGAYSASAESAWNRLRADDPYSIGNTTGTSLADRRRGSSLSLANMTRASTHQYRKS